MSAAMARLLPPFLGILLAAALGVALLNLLAGAGLKMLVLVVGALAGLVAAILSRRPKEILLAATIIALTYNRQFFNLSWINGVEGPQGMFWVLADIPMLALFAVSFAERALHRPAIQPEVLGRPGLPALPVLPLICVAGLSMLVSARPDWAFADFNRIAKFGLFLWWLERNLTPSLWVTAVGTLGVAILMQAALGLLQVLSPNASGLLSLFSLGSTPLEMQGLADNRGRGTLAHPNFFAPWLLMLAPAGLGVMLFARNPWLRLAGMVVALAGFAGIFVSKSRAPTVFALLAFALVWIAAVLARSLPLRQAVGLALLGVLGFALAMLPFLDAIAERLTGDFAASVSFRQVYNEVALDIWQSRPWLGVGPNQSLDAALQLLPTMLKIDIEMSMRFQVEASARSAAPVHNLYLLFLAEMGLLGLGAFLFLMVCILLRALRASLKREDSVRGICVGLGIGVMVQMMQQLVDFSLFWDASWYTLALIAGLLTTAPQPNKALA
jgi:O-antigen ligase